MRTKRVTTPKKPAAVDTPKPNATPVRVWTDEENEKIRLGLLNYGNDYSKIKELWFKNDGSVKPKTISNHISNIPNLKEIQQSNLAKIRDKKLEEFTKKAESEKARQSPTEKETSHNNQVKNNILALPNPNQMIAVSDVDRPKSIGGPELVIPNESFLFFQPFLKSTPSHYVYIQRRYLTMKINIDYNEEKNYLIWEFVDTAELLEEELHETLLNEKYPNIYEVPFSSPIRSFQSITVVPEDCMLETTTRRDRNTPCGAIVEVWIERRVRRDKSTLKAPNMNIKIKSTTTQPLFHYNNNDDSNHFNYNCNSFNHLNSNFLNNSNNRNQIQGNQIPLLQNQSTQKPTIKRKRPPTPDNKLDKDENEMGGFVVEDTNEENENEYNGDDSERREDSDIAVTSEESVEGGGSIHTESGEDKYDDDEEDAS
jgi:hypothetical protein